MLIRRDTYLSRLISKMNNGKIKIITGIRGSGKSYLLFELFYRYLLSQGIDDSHIIRLDLDDMRYQQYCDTAKLQQYLTSCIKNANDKYYILIDEVQCTVSLKESRHPDRGVRIYNVLNKLQEQKNIDLYVICSNTKLFTTNVMPEFVGHAEEIHVGSLVFSEYYRVHGGSIEDAWNDYIRFGGLPHILQENYDTAKIKYLTALNAEIIQKDILERCSITKAEGLQELERVLAFFLSTLTNSEKIVFDFVDFGMTGVSIPTIRSYLALLRQVFITHRMTRFDIRGRRHVNTPAKYYFSDVGMRNMLMNDTSLNQSALMENVVYNELVYRGYQCEVGIVITQMTDKDKRIRDQLEIDFAANKDKTLLFIQTAWEITDEAYMKQLMVPLMKLSDSYKKILIVGKQTPITQNEHRVQVMNIFDFLLDEHSLEK